MIIDKTIFGNYSINPHRPTHFTKVKKAHCPCERGKSNKVGPLNNRHYTFTMILLSTIVTIVIVFVYSSRWEK